MRLNVEQAAQQLRVAKLSYLPTIALSPEVADRLHFADTPSFSKFFSRLTGQSPREYRTLSGI